jgi:hypothetical protein
MTLNTEFKIYHKNIDTEYIVKGKGNSIIHANKLKINLYFDPIRRANELLGLEIVINI